MEANDGTVTETEIGTTDLTTTDSTVETTTEEITTINETVIETTELPATSASTVDISTFTFTSTVITEATATMTEIISIEIAVPTGYDCNNAQLIELGTTPYNNTGTEANIVYTCEFVGHIIWFSWIASFDGYLQASTCNAADFDTVISAYNACPSNYSAYLTCNDQYCLDTSIINVPVINGQTYYLALGDYVDSGIPGSGAGNLTLSQVDLTLTLQTDSISTGGGKVFYTVSTSAYSDLLFQ